MRSAFGSLGVPLTREEGMASLIGGSSNRPMSQGLRIIAFYTQQLPQISQIFSASLS